MPPPNARGGGFNCSTFRRANRDGRPYGSGEMDDPNSSAYHSFCMHVRKVVGVICALELLVILYILALHSDRLMVCRAVNVTTNFSNLQEEVRHSPRVPGRFTTHVEKSCSTYLLLVCIVLCHAICDGITLAAIKIERHNLVLPLLILLVCNIVVSILFLFSALVAYFFSAHHYDGYFVAFVVAQLAFRFYEISCTKKLFWFFQWAADVRGMPQSSLLRDEEEATFQL